MLGVTNQTPFTYLAHVKDLNFVRGVGGGLLWGNNLVKTMFMSVYHKVSCKFHTKTYEKGEVPQNLLARIVVATLYNFIILIIII